MKKRILSAIFAFIFTLNACGYKTSDKKEIKESEEVTISEEVLETKAPTTPTPEPTPIPTPIVEKIVISAVGDCTLGTDDNFGYKRTFTEVLDNQNRDFAYFFSGVYHLLSKDDITIANLEGTFTERTKKKEKKFNFKGDLDYTNILLEGSVEAVNLANNHTYDYLEAGYMDTINALEESNINYFGYDTYNIMNIKGKKVGLAGITGWSESSAKKSTEEAINYFKENKTDLIIISYHWGVERDYKQNADQENIARYAVDNGADLIIGTHPHVLQGIEEYNGKYIVYSLGNFVFGGNKNPSDKDTMIFQIEYTYIDGTLTNKKVNIIPCSLSGVTTTNDYRPVVLEGEEKERVLTKVLKSSTNFNY